MAGKKQSMPGQSSHYAAHKTGLACHPLGLSHWSPLTLISPAKEIPSLLPPDSRLVGRDDQTGQLKRLKTDIAVWRIQYSQNKMDGSY